MKSWQSFGFDGPPPPDNFDEDEDETDYKAEFEALAKKLKWGKEEQKATLERYNGDYVMAFTAAKRNLPD